jgi:hypothetical protein
LQQQQQAQHEAERKQHGVNITATYVVAWLSTCFQRPSGADSALHASQFLVLLLLLPLLLKLHNLFLQHMRACTRSSALHQALQTKTDLTPTKIPFKRKKPQPH